MRRLTALIKKIVPFPAEIQTEFSKIVKLLDLMPGEWIPDDLPTGTKIFVEEGFLLLTRHRGDRWRCINFYREGTTVIPRSKGAAEMQEGSLRIRAVEPSRIYYLTPDDERRVRATFPQYALADHILRRRTFLKDVEKAMILQYTPADRILFVDRYFRSLLRAPLQDLVEFLGLKSELEKTLLEALQRKRLSPKRQLAEMHN